ncbi:hypothetical protein OH76DRAFT_1483412 [Lentinus brumalis]|uniref:Uncharacterized protein n=1 Tax=Lentinus brumalis TaxID=2498619 RepID=A0A371D8Q1_9APHY|nr:hypothetical protein OH76DRAFT_1483412 [Polyporus brumalis]
MSVDGFRDVGRRLPRCRSTASAMSVDFRDARYSETSSPDRIYLHLPESGSLYAMPDLRKLGGEGVHEIDAVIIFPSAPETPLVARQPVVVVSTVNAAPGQDAEEPLECVYRFRGYLGNWSDRFRPSQMYPEMFDRPPGEVFITAQRWSRRVIIT